MPVYERSPYTLREASLRLPKEYQDLQYLARELFRPEDKLYKHQIDSLELGVKGEDVVVSTGTGSGKTECFLLPLLADLARDSLTWPACPPPNDAGARRWWINGPGGNTRPRVEQWAHHPTRPHGLRAVILYPLNALVEDQIRRLRRTLESPDVHHWLDQNRRGNRILFGRYTGQTPVSGKRFRLNEQGQLVPNHTAINRLRSASGRQPRSTRISYYRPRTTRSPRTSGICSGVRCATTSRTWQAERCGRAGTLKRPRRTF